MVHHPVGVHTMEVVLKIRQEQGAHAHSVDEHILGALNVEETDICLLYTSWNVKRMAVKLTARKSATGSAIYTAIVWLEVKSVGMI